MIPITISDLIRWKNHENLSVEQVFAMVNQLFDPPLPKYKFTELTKNYFWLNQTLDVCEACYLQFASIKLEKLRFAPENLQTVRSVDKRVHTIHSSDDLRKDEKAKKDVKVHLNLSTPKAKKDYVLKTEPTETSNPRMPTANSYAGGARILGSGKFSDRPFSRTSYATLMQPTAACINHKVDRMLPSSKRSRLLRSQREA